MFQKIIVIGCPGAGKSTFSRALRDRTGLPLYYLDQLWHKPDRTTRAREDFDRRLGDILAGERWILDGNYIRTLERRLAACDAVFLLDFPTDVCLAGVEARIGKPREDLPWVEASFDEEFRQWILDFPRDQLPGIYALLRQYQDRRIVTIFRSRRETEQWLKHLSAKNTVP